ncbi:MAG: class I SAM-dependent methyltransferase [Pirellulaceae bacterium]|nr:class I SAM-dependent methyltransferase [Pirellulaceae bacterium]
MKAQRNTHFHQAALSKCPRCNGSSHVLWNQLGHDILQGAHCDHRFGLPLLSDCHLAHVYSDDYFEGGGAGYSNYLSEGTMLRKRGRQYAKRIKKLTGKTGTVVDVGAAAGFLLQGWFDAGWTGYGVEPNATMARYGREVNRVDVRCNTFESIEDLAPNSVDCVAMLQVLPHLIDPVSAIQKANSILKPDGMLLIETWDRSSYFATFAGKG